MLAKLEGMPSSIMAFRADGQLTKSDYENVFVPPLDEAYRAGKKIRLLYQIGPNFGGMTLGAMMEDFRVGVNYLRLFERCAIVSDIEWIKAATKIFGSFIPSPTRVFSNAQLREACEWLVSPAMESNLSYELESEGVLIIHPKGPLRREDFENLAALVDPWIESHGPLNGIVLSIPKFPGWENIGSFILHFNFVRSHHKRVRKVALAMDGILPEIASQVAAHFIHAEIEHFRCNQLEEAKKWIKMRQKPRLVEK